MNVIRSLLSSGAVAATLTLGVTATAQHRAAPARSATTTTRTAEYTETSLAGDQVVSFTGDELANPAGGAYGDVIRRPPGVARAGLLRPRLNFVSELVKSVENL